MNKQQKVATFIYGLLNVLLGFGLGWCVFGW